MEDTDEKVRFLHAQFAKNQVEEVSEQTLRNWLARADKNGKAAAPDTTQRYKDNLFRLCFALEMNAEETALFMLKCCLCRHFNNKNTDEAVYFYCLSNGKNYAEAQRIIECVKHAAPAAAAENICTEQIGQDLSAFRHESDLIGYLTAHTYSREQWHHSTRTQILELLEKCKALAREDEENWPRDQEDHFAPAKELPKVLGNDRLLNIIYGFRASVRKGDGGLSIRTDYDFPEALRNNWISKQSLSDVATGKNVSDEVYRKTLILLSFYNFYADLYCAEDLWHSEDPVDVREHLQEFRDELDLQLDDCGYAQVYPRNPFDWFILNCAADPDPLRRFRDHIADFLLF